MSDDERFVLSTGRDAQLQLRDLELGTGSMIRPVGLATQHLRFVEGTHTALAVAQDYTITSWQADADTAGPTRTFVGHQAPVQQLATRAGHPRFASGSANGNIRVWGLQTGESRTLLGHSGSVDDLEILDDGAIVSVSCDGTVRHWRDDAPHTGDALRLWIEAQLATD